MHRVVRPPRDTQFNVRLDAEETDRVNRVAAHYGLNAAALVRFLVKREFDALKLGSKKR